MTSGKPDAKRTVEEEIAARRAFFDNPPDVHVCAFCGRRHRKGTFLQYDHDGQQPTQGVLA